MQVRRHLYQIRRAWQDCRGNVAIIAALAAVPLIGSVGIAVDYAFWTSRAAKLQEVADASALASARSLVLENAGAARKTAQQWVASHEPSLLKPEIDVRPEDGQVTVRLEEEQETHLSQVLGAENGRVAVAATAVASMASPICILALNPTAQKGISFSGSSSLKGPDCVVWSNSTAADSISSGPATRVEAARICAAGNTRMRGSATPAPEAGCEPVPDPLANWQPPMVGSCSAKPAEDGASTTASVRLYPGTYCGGMLIDGSDVELQPGIYILKDGPFTIRGNTRVRGKGVGIYLAGDATLDLGGGAEVELVAPATGPMSGLAVAQSPANRFGGRSSITGGVSLRVEGTIYLPGQHLRLWGNSGSEIPPAFSQLIADTIAVGGSGELHMLTDFKRTQIKPVFEHEIAVRLVK